MKFYEHHLGDYAGAAVIAVVMLVSSLVLLLSVNAIESSTRRRMAGGLAR